MSQSQQPLPRLWFDEQSEMIYIGNNLVDGLSRMQQVLLRFLIINPLIRHNQYTLMSLVWPKRDTHKSTTPNALQAHVFQIRRLIEPNPEHPQYLRTWYGRPGGYQLFPQGCPPISDDSSSTDTTTEALTIWIDEKTQNLYQGDQLLQGLSDRQCTLLKYLVKHPYTKHSREALINLGWSDQERERGVNVGALQTHIVQIRKRIEPIFSRPHFLVTWYGQDTTGYQFFPDGKLESEGVDSIRHNENEIWFDTKTQNLYRGQTLIRGLSERQVKLMQFLIQNPLVKHTRQSIIRQVWSETELGQGVTCNALQAHTYQIRQIIEPDPKRPRYLISWSGKPGGYYFVADGNPQQELERSASQRGKIWFDELTHGLYQGGRLIEGLSNKGYRLLKFLTQQPFVRHSQEKLLEQLGEEVKQTKDTRAKKLYRDIEQLRKRIELDPKNPRYLITWHGRPSGYQFLPDPDAE